MKLNGFVGKGSGKLGASVFAISGGKQIVRQYNPQVANPNTDAQVAQRAKLKLMSQLAADLSSAIAFAKQGLVSARNQFVSKNIGLVTWGLNKAQIPYEFIQLTPGGKVAPDATVSRVSQSATVTVQVSSSVDAAIKKVIVVAVDASEDERLKVVNIRVQGRASGGSFDPVNIEATTNECVIYVYGIESTSASNDPAYYDYAANNAADTAALSTTLRTLLSGAVTTKTAGYVLPEVG